MLPNTLRSARGFPLASLRKACSSSPTALGYGGHHFVRLPPFGTSGTRSLQALSPSRAARNTLSTLNPERLTSHEYWDLSDKTQATGRVTTSLDESVSKFGMKYFMRGFSNVPFPENTGGFFYYYKPPPSQPLAGQIRFRVTNDPNPASFHKGHDLLHSDERLPWNITVPAILRSKNLTGYVGLSTLLQQEGVIEPAIVEACAKNQYNIQRSAHLYLKFGDPFYLDFQRERYLWFTIGDKLEKRSIGFFSQPSPGIKEFPYKGSAHLQFEKSVTEEGQPAAAIRVVKIFDPIEPAPDCLPGSSFAPPEEGKLLTKKSGKHILRLVDPDPDSPTGALFASAE